MNNSYLIPANSKKSQLIFGFFTPRDLIVAGLGAAVSIALLLMARQGSLKDMLLAALPLCIGAFLVFPVPHYHNVMQLGENIIFFIFGRKKYYWKGWCVKDDSEE